MRKNVSNLVILHEFCHESNVIEVLGRGGGHGHEFANCLMEAVVSTIPEPVGKVLVLHEVLDVAHLMVDCVPVLKVVVIGAHFNPVILATREINLVVTTNLTKHLQYAILPRICWHIRLTQLFY